MADHEEVLIFDFGSQYSQLIARRVRKLGVYCQIVPHDLPAERAARPEVRALVLSGGPASVYADGAPMPAAGILEAGVPILGISYGMQILARLLGGKVERRGGQEYGPARLEIASGDGLLAGLDSPLDVWMSHGDRVVEMHTGFVRLAGTAECPIAAMGDAERGVYGVQFHPEVAHTPRGRQILSNFLFGIAGGGGGWTMSNFIETSVADLRQRVGGGRVICALSGGADSPVVAALLKRAVGDRMTAVFVDNGLLRAGEAEQVRHSFHEDYPLNLRFVNARKRFLSALAGVTDPEEIESVSTRGGPSATIKSHHNVGGLPERLGFELIEPLRELFKDEVRRLGAELGLPQRLLKRQPFPGPGLAVRIIGEVTAEQLELLRSADQIVQQELERYDGYAGIWQSFAVLLPVKSVGVMGDERTYENAVAIRAVTSTDGMTADWARLPAALLGRLSARIINEVKGVNRVVYDVSSKPHPTIEWE